MVLRCPTCESTEYEEIDGLFYCTTCCTQSQEIHLQETAELEIMTPGNFKHMREVKKARKKFKISRDHGRPWSIYEAYQCIILAQCDALIRLGAKPDLKEIVFTIWANYLSKLKVAFCTNEKIVPDFVMKCGYGRQRELYRGTLDKPWNRIECHRYDRRIPEKMDESDGEIESLPFLEKKPYNEAERHLVSPEWMNIRKTAAFCFIGLRFTNPEIHPCRFLRWISESKVPFLSTSHLLKPDMHLFGDDTTLFRPPLMSVDMLVEDMVKLAVFLDMKNIPEPKLETVICQMLDELALPRELNAICKRFCSQVPTVVANRKRPRFYNYKKMDFEAARFIAFVLKVIFGLDDTTENLLSDYSLDVQKVTNTESKVFVWRKWRGYQMERQKREYVSFPDTVKHTKENDYQHLHQLCEINDNINRDERYEALHHSSRDNHRVNMNIKKPIQMALSGSSKNKEQKSPAKAHDSNPQLKDELTGSTMSHLVDFDTFEARHLDTCKHSHQDLWTTLKQKRVEIGNQTHTRKYESEWAYKSSIQEVRPHSYIWLLELLANAVGSNVTKLDTSVNFLQSAFEKKVPNI